ncbi:hypothetical protein [Rickettsia endosymbiont of Cantharis rufa]|uniref:hypothetical protein n=1 Tax=Rickettsia endosymbiont of Cantharis rufa TaxID=3066248 RepID=UPI003132DBEA
MGKNFEDNVDLLTNEIEKLLNPNFENILPKNVFLRPVDNKKEEEINKNDKKLLENNLKFFTIPSIFAVLGYGPFNENEYNSSLTYYQNNPESLIPNLILLKTTHDGAKISKLKDILNNHYLKAKSAVGNCFNVILKYHECYKSLETINLSTDVIKQDLLDKLPGLTDKIEIVLNSLEVENVKNITLLCKEAKDFLNISPITSVFEEYDDNYQALKYDVDKAEEILGEIGIEWSFS